MSDTMEYDFAAQLLDNDGLVDVAALIDVTFGDVDIWAQLANGDHFTRARVAHNRHAPGHIVHHVVIHPCGDTDHDHTTVVYYAAQNPACPPETLALLADHDVNIVRMYVASNPSTPADTVAALATDPEDGVRYHVAKNPHCPTSVLRTLCDDDELIARRARTTLDGLRAPR
jgi:hypothetical protein